MVSKRYRKLPEHSAAQSMIREAKAEAYGREKDRKDFLQSSLSVASLKRKLKKPVKRSKNQIAWALEIAGIGEGPDDLSKNKRAYLSANK
jgi:hypothetical protein